MSNELYVEVQNVKVRYNPEEPYNQIKIFDDHENFEIYLNTDEPPTDPGELLKMIFKENNNRYGVMSELFQFHIDHNSGVDIEGDWIEWDDQKIKLAMDYWKNPNKHSKIKVTKHYADNDIVDVPEPGEDDSWNNEFTGTIVVIKKGDDGNDYAVVEDQDGNSFDVCLDKLKRIE